MTDLSDLSIPDLAREIAARMSPDSLLDAEDVAAILKCSARQVLERYALADGFPRTIRLRGVGGARSHPRWMRSDIIEWIEKHRQGRPPGGGRPRKIV